MYAFTAARLASGIINFEEVGPILPDSVFLINYQKPILKGDSILGNIPILDIQYGNVWTNISDSLFKKLSIKTSDILQIRIWNNDSLMYLGAMAYATTFGEVPEMNPLCFLNSLMNVSLALNMGNFADSFRIQSGPEWSISIKKDRLGK